MYTSDDLPLVLETVIIAELLSIGDQSELLAKHHALMMMMMMLQIPEKVGLRLGC